MCFHSSALTAGMTKNGEISSTRTMPRPGKGSFTSSASSTPNTTVITITLPISSSVFHTAGQKSGSVMKYSKLPRPTNGWSPGCIRL
jgi:hypothetical protein